MLNVSLIAIGKLKEKYLQSAVDEYAKRLTAFCKFSVIELPEEPQRGENAAEIDRVVNSEGKRIIEKISSDALVVSLCIEGKQLTSPEFSEYISNAAVTGKSKIVFIIGGSNGLSDKVKNRSDLKLSFSEMTFPHQLFRVMLCEQIYRAFSISKGTKYHK